MVAAAFPQQPDCAICFDALARPLQLPCACHVDYCAHCWEACLLQSTKAVGYARCPTCRQAVHLDFDADTLQLVASARASRAEEVAEGEEPQADAREQRERLMRQARPAQVRLLAAFGREHPELRRLARSVATRGGDAARSDSSTRQLLHACGGSTAKLASLWADMHGPPQCMCGGTLHRLAAGEAKAAHRRPSLSLSLNSSNFSFVEEAERCDLCEESLPSQAATWTCTANYATVLHTSAYNICDACVAQHVLLEPRRPSAQRTPAVGMQGARRRSDRIVVISAFSKSGERSSPLASCLLRFGLRIQGTWGALQAAATRSCASRWSQAGRRRPPLGAVAE